MTRLKMNWISHRWLALMLALLIAALMTVPVLADAPGTGVVVEGRVCLVSNWDLPVPR
jgi:hypothetical protein